MSQQLHRERATAAAMVVPQARPPFFDRPLVLRSNFSVRAHINNLSEGAA